jgi:hypothetical protein
LPGASAKLFAAPVTADWNCKDGAAHTSQNALGRAPTQRIKKVHMPLGRQHHQVGTPMSFFVQNLIHDIALSHNGFTGPTSVFPQINFWRCSRTPDVNQAKFSRHAVKSSRQQQSLSERRLRVGMMIDGNENPFQSDRTVIH